MTTNTGGGSTASFSNTPQAKGDSYTASENRVYTFDVMANDLGGAAKILWSIDDSDIDGSTLGDGTGDGIADLLTRDVARAVEFSDLGARIWIEAGKIQYDTGPLDRLAEGETATDRFTYAIRLANGTLSWATATIVVTGTNDKPEITAAKSSGAVVEDGAVAGGTLTDGGVIAFRDVDLKDAHTVSVTPGFDGYVGALTASVTNASTGDGAGAVTWSFAVDNAAVQHLRQGQVLTQTYTVTISDGKGGTVAQTVTVTLTGTNDVPVIAGTAAGGVSEDGTASASGQLTIIDADTGESSFKPVAAGTPGFNGHGTFTVTANGAWSYALANDNAAVQALGAGETLTDTIEVTSFDGTAKQVITVTITGTNDQPEITSADASGAVVEDGALSDTGVIAFTDVDLKDAHSVSVTPAATGYLGALTASLTNPSTGDGAGEVTWSFAVDNAAVQHLAEGERLTQTYTVAVSDGKGGTADQQVTVTITGTNDRPEITSADSSGAVVEDANNGALTDSGVIAFKDVDLKDAHAVSVTPAATGYLGALTASVTNASTGDGAGEVTWSFAVDNAAVQHLRAGEALTQSYNVALSDGQGGLVTQVVTVTITGTNDVPVIGGAVSGGVTEDGTLTASGQLTIADADTGQSAFNAIAAGTPGLNGYGAFSVSANGAWSYALTNSNAAVQALGLGETLTDRIEVSSLDGSKKEFVTVTITGTNDRPEVTAADLSGAVVEDATAATLADSGVIAFGDVDLTDGHSVAVTPAATGYLGSLTASVTNASTGDGAGAVTWSFAVDNAAVQHLRAGEVLTQNYTVAVSDGKGGAVSQVVTVTITGTNDLPVIGGVATGEVTEDGTLTTGGKLTITDADAGQNEFQTIAAGTPGAGGHGAFAVASNGSWTYALNNNSPVVQALNANETLTDTIVVTSADGSRTQTLSVTIKGVNDVVVVTAPREVTDGVDFNDNDSAGPGVTETITSNRPNGSQVWTGTVNSDDISAGGGDDAVYGYGGNDRINGENGFDISLFGQAGDDVLSGGIDGDRLFGGSGRDVLWGNADGDPNPTADGADQLYGGSGADQIFGQGGDDLIVGGLGADTLSGGAGSDTFVFLDVRDTNDTITDFVLGTDKLDFSGIDANSTTTNVNEAFRWGGDDPTAFGLWFTRTSTGSVIYGDTDGNLSTAEFMLTLTGVDLTPLANVTTLPSSHYFL